MSRKLLLAPATALVLVHSAQAQTTWIVDDDGPADFTTPQAAIDAASDGDTILVRAGNYFTANIDGKGLTLLGEGTPSIMPILVPLPALTVRNLAADQAVYVRGFKLGGFGATEFTSLVVENCAGPVLAEDMDVLGFGPAVGITDSASVTISDSVLDTPGTFASFDLFSFLGFSPFAGLTATDSTVFLYDCEVSGSNGASAVSDTFVTIPPEPSGPGVFLIGSTLHASGCSFLGGNGGSGTALLCFPGKDGSPGLRVQGTALNPAPSVTLLDTQTTGGFGGSGSCGDPDGDDAQASLVEAGTLDVLPGAARSFAGTSPVLEGSSIDVQLEGQPGDVLILHVQLEAAPGLFLSQYNIALHMPLPTAVVGLGALPGSGSLGLSFPVPNLANGIDSSRFVGQVLFVDGAAQVFDGGPSVVVITDSAL